MPSCAITVREGKAVDSEASFGPSRGLIQEDCEHSDGLGESHQRSTAYRNVVEGEHARRSTRAAERMVGVGGVSVGTPPGLDKSGGKASRGADEASSVSNGAVFDNPEQASRSSSTDVQYVKKHQRLGSTSPADYGDPIDMCLTNQAQSKVPTGTRGTSTRVPDMSVGRDRGIEKESSFAGDAERAAARAAERAAEGVTAVAAAVTAAVEEQRREDEADDEKVENEEAESIVPMALGTRWKRRITFVVRTMQIWAFLFHVLLKLVRQKLVQRDEARMSARRRKLGRYLCRAFLKLGPTFIKIGQVCHIPSLVSHHLKLFDSCSSHKTTWCDIFGAF